MSDYKFSSIFRQIPLETWKKVKKKISELSQRCQETVGFVEY